MEKRRSTSLRLSDPHTKLIARDISDSLGKLPPQAIDLEVYILGALMLEKGALPQVPYLKHHHFYDDKHSEIFQAITAVASTGAMPDMRLVIAHLRSVGKIELIGGAYYVAELTSKVSSASNIEYHARIVIEMAMKRHLIGIASKIHYNAYEDTTDVFTLLKETQEDIKFLEDRETSSSGPERIKALWEKTLVTTKPEEQPPLIMLGDKIIATPGNHSLLVGKKKSRKSLLVVFLLSIFLKPRENMAEDIAIFDTEQGKKHVWQTKDRLFRMTNQHVPIFYMRGMSPQERRDFIEMTVVHWPEKSKRKLRIIAIDGIRDCMVNINDPDETTGVIVWLEKLTLNHNIHIIDILHLNKTDNNARGHIGSELLNKAEITIEVEYDEKSTYSVVKCESSREIPFENFAFTHGLTGLPEIVGVPLKESVPPDEKVKRLMAVFEDQSLKYNEVLDGVKAEFSVGQNKAKQLIAEFVRVGWVMKSGELRSAKSTYKLMVSPGSYAPPPVVQPNPQTKLELVVDVNYTDDLPF